MQTAGGGLIPMNLPKTQKIPGVLAPTTVRGVRSGTTPSGVRMTGRRLTGGTQAASIRRFKRLTRNR